MFTDCSSLTDVTIGNGVTRISESAFSGCTNLTSITIGNSVTEIGSGAFSGCSSLASIIIPDSVTSIGNFAFENCSNLTSITIPESVTNIGRQAFLWCSNLTDVYITDIATWCNITFGDNPLDYASNLYLNGELITKLVIPEGVAFIPNCAFKGLSSITNITIPDSVTSIGGEAFKDCLKLKSVTIGNSVTSIGGGAFSGCSSLTSITIPDSVTSIGDLAFYYCDNLTSVTIGNSVTSIGRSAFYTCNKIVEVINHSSLDITAGLWSNGYVALYAIEVHTGESKIVNMDNYLFYTYENVNYLLGYIGEDTELVLPESYNGEGYEIYKHAFYNYDSLTSVTIPNSVTSVGSQTFTNCDHLTIYCEAESQPDGWDSNWNSTGCPVVWGAK